MNTNTAPRQRRSKKAIEKMVDDVIASKIHGIQFDIMDLGKLTKAGMDAVASGADLNAAIDAAIAQYRRN